MKDYNLPPPPPQEEPPPQEPPPPIIMIIIPPPPFFLALQVLSRKHVHATSISMRRVSFARMSPSIALAGKMKDTRTTYSLARAHKLILSLDERAAVDTLDTRCERQANIYLQIPFCCGPFIPRAR